MKGDIISITLTELTLVLLFLVTAITYPHIFSNRKSELIKMKAELDRTRAELNLTINKLNTAMTVEENDEMQKEMTSTHRPTCTESGIIEGFLTSITILPDGEYQIDNNKYSFPELRDLFADPLSAAEEAGCVHSIKVYHDSSASLDVYLKGLRRLEQLFYIKRIQK